MNKPEYGKLYSLTGGKGQKCIVNGNTWTESEVRGCSRCKGHIESEGIGNLCCKKCLNLNQKDLDRIFDKELLCQLQKNYF